MTRTNWNKTIWQSEIAKLPAGLSIPAIARKLKKRYAVTHLWLKHYKYKFPDTRGKWSRNGHGSHCKKLDTAKVDWNMTDAAIAKQFGVSRQRVGIVRQDHGKAKVGK